MEIIEYYSSQNKEYWLNEIGKSDWGAGKYLYSLLKENKLKKLVGEEALVLLLIEDNKLISFCTYAPLDDIQPTILNPWIGFLYTFSLYRGNHYAKYLLDKALALAIKDKKEYVYISTNHIGLYEKYGFEFYKIENDIEGFPSRIYRKKTGV